MNYTENYPEVIRLKAQIEKLKRNIKAGDGSSKSKTSSMSSVNPLYQQVQQQIFDAEVEASSLQARKTNLEKRIKEREASLRDVPENRKTLGVLVQERDSNKQIYQELLARMGQSEVSKQMEISDKAATFRIVDPALFPEAPVSPNMIRMLLLALAAGFGCGFGVIFLLDLLDTSIKNPQQLESAGIELIAIIPTIDNGLPKTKNRRRDLLTYAVTACYYTGFLIIFTSAALNLNLTEKLHILIKTL
jgi:polysaccharide chain length determinant protein (PEP-CTERM system associated)